MLISCSSRFPVWSTSRGLSFPFSSLSSLSLSHSLTLFLSLSSSSSTPPTQHPPSPSPSPPSFQPSSTTLIVTHSLGVGHHVHCTLLSCILHLISHSFCFETPWWLEPPVQSFSILIDGPACPPFRETYDRETSTITYTLFVDPLRPTPFRFVRTLLSRLIDKPINDLETTSQPTLRLCNLVFLFIYIYRSVAVIQTTIFNPIASLLPEISWSVLVFIVLLAQR